MLTYKTNSPEETILLGQKIGEKLSKGDIIAMHGTLAAGKTTITKGIALGLGIDEALCYSLVREKEVKSFAILNKYSDKYRFGTDSGDKKKPGDPVEGVPRRYTKKDLCYFCSIAMIESLDLSES